MYHGDHHNTRGIIPPLPALVHRCGLNECHLNKCITSVSSGAYNTFSIFFLCIIFIFCRIKNHQHHSHATGVCLYTYRKANVNFLTALFGLSKRKDKNAFPISLFSAANGLRVCVGKCSHVIRLQKQTWFGGFRLTALYH